MQDEEIEIIDSPNDEVSATNESEGIDSKEVDVEKLIETNKKLFVRAKTAEGFVQDSDGNWVKKQKPQPAVKSELSAVDDVETLIENISVLKGLEDDEISDLKLEAKSLGVPVVKYIKSKAGQIHLKEVRREKKSKEASPEIGSSSPIFKKHTEQDLKSMSSDELAKILPHAS